MDNWLAGGGDEVEWNEDIDTQQREDEDQSSQESKANSPKSEDQKTKSRKPTAEWTRADKTLDDPFKNVRAITEESFEVDQIESIQNEGDFEVGDGMYCPAFSVLMNTVFESAPEKLQVGDRRLTWWEDESLVPKHPVTLVNPMTWAQSAEVPDDLTHGVLGMDPEDTFVFSDSGGFQVKSFEEMCVVDSPDMHSFRDYRVMPEKLLEWQVKNASAGPILDFSPYTVDSNEGKTESIAELETFEETQFNPNLEQTAENAERMYDHRQRIGADDFKLYNVLHGTIPFDNSTRPTYYMDKWFDRVKDIGKFDGWGIGGGSNNMGKIALGLAYASENIDESHLHFFGTGSLGGRAIIEYWRLYNGEEYAITSDSTSFEVGSQYRQFFSPLMHGQKICVSQRSEEQENIIADVTPCHCSVCAQMEREHGPTWVWDKDDAQTGVALNLHNLNQFLSRHKTIQALVQGSGKDLPDRYVQNGSQSKSVFWSSMDNIFSNETVRNVWECMKFIRRVEEDGMSAACDDFVFESPYTDVKGPLIYEKNVGGFDEW